jgi:hypothetical protein
MAALLNDLEFLADQHSELLDTDVRERLWSVVDAQLLRQDAEVQVPDDLGMFTPEGNTQLQRLMQQHLVRLRAVFSALIPEPSAALIGQTARSG